MSTRYFKATDGTTTYFRASPSRVYMSVTGFVPGGYGYTFHRDSRGHHPAVEITRHEYKALVELKIARLAREKAAFFAKHPGVQLGVYAFKGDAPSDSWVTNADVEHAKEAV